MLVVTVLWAYAWATVRKVTCTFCTIALATFTKLCDKSWSPYCKIIIGHEWGTRLWWVGIMFLNLVQTWITPKVKQNRPVEIMQTILFHLHLPHKIHIYLLSKLSLLQSPKVHHCHKIYKSSKKSVICWIWLTKTNDQDTAVHLSHAFQTHEITSRF